MIKQALLFLYSDAYLNGRPRLPTLGITNARLVGSSDGITLGHIVDWWCICKV